jgi:hypothetical protein
MARYILIEVDDNEAAGDFIYALQNYPDGIFFHKKLLGGNVDHDEYKVEQLGSARVRGLMGKPSQFCECVNPGDKQVLGKKFGWYVHAECAKPLRGHAQHPRNLLDPEGMPSRERMFYLGIWEGVDKRPELKRP